MTAQTCRVTVGLANDQRKVPHPPCGLPVFRHGLCAAHYADRIRIGGKP